jgi:hypothetical protein
LEKKAQERLTELGKVILRVPFTLEHAKEALDMVDARVPPNGPKNQQFKDSAIWQAVLSLCGEYRVHLVTNDRAFLIDRDDPTKGLANNLADDARRADGEVLVHCDIRSCLKAICADVPAFDRNAVLPLIEASYMPRLDEEAAERSVRAGERIRIDLDAFRTATPDRVAVDYTAFVRCITNPAADAARSTDCRAIIHGSCYYEIPAASLSGHFIDHIAIEWKWPSGYTRWHRSVGGDDPSIPLPRPITLEWES